MHVSIFSQTWSEKSTERTDPEKYYTLAKRFIQNAEPFYNIRHVFRTVTKVFLCPVFVRFPHAFIVFVLLGFFLIFFSDSKNCLKVSRGYKKVILGILIVNMKNNIFKDLFFKCYNSAYFSLSHYMRRYKSSPPQ